MTEYNFTIAAKIIAIRAHRGQTYPPADSAKYLRKEGVGAEDEKCKYVLPFTAHLGHVIGVLHRFSWNNDPDLIAAAWLHDTLEDTDLKAEEILHVCGDRTLMLVQAVTDEPGANRAERKAKTYPKIVAAGKSAVLLKLADRIANVEASILGGAGHDFLSVYKREYPAFREALHPVGDEVMWHYLDTLMGVGT